LIKDFYKNNKLIIILFLFSTLFFIYQRNSGGVHWDFALYVSNAKYLFSNGFYFEWWVPPFTPFLLGSFSIFGWFLAEYVYIIFVSSLFLFSCLKFSEVFKINKTFFYATFINSYVLYHGLRNGTELLSLSFLILFFTLFFKKNKEFKSSMFLSLSFLTRYSNIFLLPLIFLKKNLKIIFFNFLIFFILLIPWLLYNYVISGNPLTSLSDYYVFIYLQKLYYGDEIISYISLFIIGFFVITFIALRKKLRKFLDLKDASMVFLIVIVIVSFLNMPFKDLRYLFNISLPIIYFFVKFTTKFKKILYLIIAINFITIMTIIPLYTSAEDIYFRNFKFEENCMLMSNAWVYFDYYDIPTEPYPWQEFFDKKVEEGYRIILFKWIREPDYVKNETFLAQFPIIENTSNYVIIGNKNICKEFYKINKTFTERKNEFLLTKNSTIKEEINCHKDILSKVLCNILEI